MATLAMLRQAIIDELYAESQNPKPSYNIDGQQVDWNGYRASLMQQLKDLGGADVYQVKSQGISGAI